MNSHSIIIELATISAKYSSAFFPQLV